MRNYGRTATSIWRDDEFRKLSSDARFTYVMLYNQPNISAAGVLEITAKRWAGNLGFTPDQLSAALDELEDNRYTVPDWDSEELLVRSFVRWDGGVNNDLRRKAIREAASQVASPIVRASVAVELDRLALPHDLSIAPRSPIEARGVVVKDLSEDPQPLSATREPEPSLTPFCSKHPRGTDQPCGPCGTAKLRFAAESKAQAARASEADHRASAAVLAEAAAARAAAVPRPKDVAS